LNSLIPLPPSARVLPRTVPEQRFAALPLSSGPMPYTVTLVPGDGTGPELTEATRRVLEATGV